MRRRDVVKLLAVGALAATAPRVAAQGREVVIGVLYPLSGSRTSPHDEHFTVAMFVPRAPSPA